MTFARFNHAADAVQQQFYVAVGGRPGGFEPRLRATEERLKRLKNYRSYLACGSNHCALPTQEFYSLRVDGMSAPRLGCGPGARQRRALSRLRVGFRPQWRRFFLPSATCGA